MDSIAAISGTIAREALPYWLQRVRELEATVRLLEKQLEIAAQEITNAHEEYDMCPSEYDGNLTCVCDPPKPITEVWQCWRKRWEQKSIDALREATSNA